MIDGLNIQDDSWAEVTIGAKTVKVDLYRAYNVFLVFDREVRELHPADEAARQVAYSQRVVAYLHSIGFECVGDRAASRFEDALMKAVDEMGKADASAQTPA